MRAATAPAVECHMLVKAAAPEQNRALRNGASDIEAHGDNESRQLSGAPLGVKQLEEARSKKRLHRAISIVATVLITMCFLIVGTMLALHSNINDGMFFVLQITYLCTSICLPYFCDFR
jgi:hypothetical protein